MAEPKVEATSALATLLPEAAQPYAGLIEGALLALAIFIIGWIVSKWANGLTKRLLKRGKVDEALSRFLGNIVQYAVLAAAVIAALEKVGVQTTSLVAIFASAGLAVGLALQGSLSNFASGVMILFFRPFSLDDVVTVAGVTAAVKDIGIFSTTVQTPDNDKIIIPNAKITGDVIKNHTVIGTRRAGIDIGVAYGSDIKEIEKLCMGVANANSLVLSDPGPGFAFTEMGASSINFKLFVFSKQEDWLAVQDQVRRGCYDALNEAGIDIPFDQVVVHNA